jgi:hypothetical protein
MSTNNELVIGVTSLLVIVSLVTVGSYRNSLGLLLEPHLVTFGAALCALFGCLEWRPSTTAGCCLPVVLDENVPDRLLSRGVPGGDVEQLLHGLWLVMAELMHLGSIVHAGPECRDEVGVTNLGELVPLSEETLDVIPQGFALLLLTTLQILRVARCNIPCYSSPNLSLITIINSLVMHDVTGLIHSESSQRHF